jgi:hypothetical protein
MLAAGKFCNKRDQLRIIRKYFKYLIGFEKRNIFIWMQFILGHRLSNKIRNLKIIEGRKN